MNHRVLELLKTPKNIQSEDLHLLKEEINSFPYIQNIRALYLYGVHLYDKDNYQKVLSTTAAYTTDKKILYQLINGKIQQKPKPEIKQETVKEKIIPAENPLKILYQTKAGSFPLKREENPVAETQQQIVEETVPQILTSEEENRILPPPREEIKHLYVNGERNRILFEGEENFLEDNTFETIDLESTLESGSIVTQKAEKKEEPVSEEKPTENILPIAEENEESVPKNATEEEKSVSENKLTDNSEPESYEPEAVSDIQADEENKTVEEEKEETSENALNESENSEEKPSEEISEFAPETIVEEENLHAETEKEEISDKSELSFHETEAFLPELQVSANESVEEPENESNESGNSEITASEESAEFTPETIIDEDQISSDKEEKTIQNDSELSFHGTESFLPEVKIQANTEDKIAEVPQLNLNKHEDEMRRLIEEVEKKMKEKAAAEEHKKEEEPENIGHDISFAETQSFEVKPIETESKEETAKENPAAENNSKQIEEPKAEITEEKEEIPVKEEAEVKSAWKPMSFDSNLPDSLISKSPEVAQPKAEEQKADKTVEIQQPQIAEQKQIAEAETEQNSEESIVSEISENAVEQNTDENISENSEENKEEVPVMNVSFFGSGWTIPQPEKEKMTEESKQESKEEENTVEIPVEKPAKTANPNTFDSNVPGFINTWQSWLKIDRTEEKPKEEKTDLKTKVIETFIENNPRISQLKEESTFVVKEKGDDISHLMTETLANLYFEQKLYTKAIKAFEILIKKTPEKKKYYEGKIQEIKDFRTKG